MEYLDTVLRFGNAIIVAVCQFLVMVVISIGVVRALGIFLKDVLTPGRSAPAIGQSRLELGHSFSLALGFLIGAAREVTDDIVEEAKRGPSHKMNSPIGAFASACDTLRSPLSGSAPPVISWTSSSSGSRNPRKCGSVTHTRKSFIGRRARRRYRLPRARPAKNERCATIRDRA